VKMAELCVWMDRRLWTRKVGIGFRRSGIRDNGNSGSRWTVRATGWGEGLATPQVVTRLPFAGDQFGGRGDKRCRWKNETGAIVGGTLEASFDSVKVAKTVSLGLGKNTVTLASSEFTQLKVAHPRFVVAKRIWKSQSCTR